MTEYHTLIGVADTEFRPVVHCWCGHSAPPHTETQCHRCPCTQLTICTCGENPQ